MVILNFEVGKCNFVIKTNDMHTIWYVLMLVTLKISRWRKIFFALVEHDGLIHMLFYFPNPRLNRHSIFRISAKFKYFLKGDFCNISRYWKSRSYHNATVILLLQVDTLGKSYSGMLKMCKKRIFSKSEIKLLLQIDRCKTLFLVFPYRY